MKFQELKKLSQEDLDKKEKELGLELMKDYAQRSAGAPPKNPGLIKERKKTIAKIKTLIRQRASEGNL